MRIPERGGVPKEGIELPRGNLLLTVRSGSEPALGVTRLPGPSIPPPPVTPELVGIDTAPREPDRVLWLLLAAVVAALAAWFLR